jgi:hypothetical protein
MALANSKSTLAKLLAQENISVQHKKTSTAYFDPKNRILVLPIWKEMSGDLYDLLVGHEVGHAWETPPDGWHDAVRGHTPGFKSYLNVIEDARIEKCIKLRYPGLRSSFYKAYKDLVDRDFFGIKDIDVNTLPFIDRINLHFKVGPFMAVPFSDTEQVYVKRIDSLKSWDEVLTIAKELYNNQKSLNEEKEIERRKKLKINGDIEDFDGEFSDDFDVGSDLDDEDDFDDFDEQGNQGEHRGLNGSNKHSDPSSITDQEFRTREADLLSNDVRPYKYFNLPDANFEEIIIPHSYLYKNTDWYCFDLNDRINNSNLLLSNYKQTNAKFIQYLVKEFELKRNASQFARAKVSKTGELNLDKIFSYKFNDDLFKRVTKIPGGKNHGMVMFIDWSGSMTENINQTIEQTLVLADFCKKVNIPFRVFSFTDSSGGVINSYFREKHGPNYRYERKSVSFSNKPLDLSLTNSHYLSFELLSNSMTTSQYNFAQKKLLQFGALFVKQRYRMADIPDGWQLNSTPLNEAIVFANHYIPKFKEMYKLDIINTIFLTDGDGNHTDNIVTPEGENKNANSYYGIGYRQPANIVVTDPKTRISGYANPNQKVTAALLDLLRKNTGTNLVGYYIMPKISRGYILRVLDMSGLTLIEDSNIIMNKMRKDKFYSLSTYAYDKYFLVSSDDLIIDEEEMIVTSDTSKKDLMKAFIKNRKSKLMNRILLNKFIEEIA